MKILKKILFVFLGLIVLWLVAAIFIDGKCNYEKSISINAPAEKVWQHISSVKAMDEWSPWNAKDPDLKKTFTGNPGTIGEKQCWKSRNKELGNGCVTLTKLDKNKLRSEAEMKFLTPYESEAQEFLQLTPENGGTKATWGFSSDIPYPFTVMKLFMNLDNLVGPDYQSGLEKLKALAEKP